MMSDDDDYAEALGIAVVDAAVAAGLTAAQTATAAGTSKQTLYRWIYGTRGAPPSLPSMRLLLRVARALGTTPAAILAAAEEAQDG